MIQKNDLYDYGAYIYQDDAYFKFSLDSILLAEFVQFKSNDSILDICSGNVPVPLILTIKDNSLKIDAVEIQKEIYDLAKKSIEENKFANINLYNADAKNYTSNKKYDIVTCNPPYFAVTEKSILSENSIKRVARHEVLIDISSVISVARKNLKENGKLYIVHRTNRFLDVVDELRKQKFGIRKICFVETSSHTINKAEFFLIESVLSKKSDPKISSINIANIKTYKNLFKE